MEKELFEYLLKKIINSEIKNRKLDKRNKELENMHKAAQDIIQNLKLEISILKQ